MSEKVLLSIADNKPCARCTWFEEMPGGTADTWYSCWWWGERMCKDDSGCTMWEGHRDG